MKKVFFAIVFQLLFCRCDDGGSNILSTRWQKIKNFINKHKFSLAVGLPLAYWAYCQAAYYNDLMGYGWKIGDPYLKNYIAVAAKEFGDKLPKVYNKRVYVNGEKYDDDYFAFKSAIKNAIKNYILYRDEKLKNGEKMYRIFDLMQDPTTYYGPSYRLNHYLGDFLKPGRDYDEEAFNEGNHQFVGNRYVQKSILDERDLLSSHLKENHPELPKIDNWSSHLNTLLTTLGTHARNYIDGSNYADNSSERVKTFSRNLADLPTFEETIRALPYSEAMKIAKKSNFKLWR